MMDEWMISYLSDILDRNKQARLIRSLERKIDPCGSHAGFGYLSTLRSMVDLIYFLEGLGDNDI